MIKPWTKVETKKIHDFPFFQVIEDTVLSPGGEKRLYTWIKMRRPFVMIIPIDSDGKIWTVGSHRYPIGKFTIEFPGGVVDLNETPLEAAKRELEEEIHLKSDEWTDLGFIKEIGVSVKAKGRIYLAKNVKKIPNPRTDPLDENMFEIHQYSTNYLSALISDDQITDTATIAAFCRAHLKGLLN